MSEKLPNEHIAAAAVRLHDSGLVIHLPIPARHHSVLHAFARLVGHALQAGDHTQGFLSKTGEFLDRREAAALVGKTGQLYSEDLW